MKALLGSFMLLLLVSQAFSQPHGPDTLWTKVFTGLSLDIESGLVCMQGGKTLVSGTMSYMNYRDAFILRLDSLGNRDTLFHYGVWNQSESGDAFCRNTDGSLTLAGRCDNGVCVFRLDSLGRMLWERSYGFLQNIPMICPTHDNGIIILSWGYSKIDEQGDTLWFRRYFPFHNGEYIISMKETLDGGSIFTGIANLSNCLFLYKADSSGNTQFLRYYDFTTQGWDVSCLRDGGYLVASTYTDSNATHFGIILFRTDAAGDTLWTRNLPSEGGSSVPLNILETRDGNFTIFGMDSPVYPRLIRITPDGEILWTRTYDLRGAWPLATGFDVDAEGRYVFSYCLNNHDLVVVKTEVDSTIRSEVHDTFIPQPTSIGLSVYPNPFNAVAQITFSLSSTQKAKIVVFDLLGREVAVLKDEMMFVGEHRVAFDASNLASGIYFCSLRSNGIAKTQKMVLMK